MEIRCAALDRQGRMMFDGVTMRRTVFVTAVGIVDLHVDLAVRIEHVAAVLKTVVLSEPESDAWSLSIRGPGPDPRRSLTDLREAHRSDRQGVDLRVAGRLVPPAPRGTLPPVREWDGDRGPSLEVRLPSLRDD